MQRSRVSTQAWMAVALIAALPLQHAKGDGGVVVLHEAKGPFLVTVFVAPEVIRGGLTDVSVLLQSRTNGDVVLDAAVGLTVERPLDLVVTAGSEPVCGMSSASVVFPSQDIGQHQAPLPATREQASNKLLYAAALALNATGDWRLHISVSRGPDSAKFNCLIPVTQASANAPGLWPYLLIPPIAIAAFAMNQKLRRHSLEVIPDSQSKKDQFRIQPN
jgi:hypothetical protein